jgi:iron complex outermembrane recepter protein
LQIRTIVLALLVCTAGAQEKEPEKFTVVVTGTFAPVPAEDLNRAVNVIDIRHRRTLFGSFADVLKDDSSIDLRQRGPNDIQGDISIRGGTFAQTLVLLNGIRLNDSQSSHHNLDLPVPLEAMSEVQILHGSGSTQYGSDAVTGVVNILTKVEAPEARIRGALGNFGVNEESGSIAGGLHHISGQLIFSRSFSSGFLPDRDYRSLELTSISHAVTRLGATDLLLTLSDRPFGADQFYGNFNSWERTKGWFASVRQELGSQTEIDFAYRRHTDLFVLYRDQPEIFTNRHALDSWEGDLRRRENLPGKGRLFYGIETYADAIDSNNLGRHSRVREAGYAAYEAQWHKRVSLTAGLRDEIFGAFRHELSPTASAAFWLSPKWKIRAAVSRAFRLPTYTDLYYHDPANVGSPDLRPESAWNYEAGIDWRPASRVRVEATVFERRDRDLIDYVRYSANDIYRATNFQKLTFTGVETSVNVRAGRTQMFTASYTGLHGDRALLPGAVSKYVFNYPVNSGVLSWQGDLGSQVVARMRIGVLDRYARDPYALWDASFSRSQGRMRPFLQFTNLTSTIYEEIPGVIMPKRGIIGGVELRLYGDH